MAGVPDRLIFPFLPGLASGWAAACFLANASRSVSVNFLGSVILLFTSLVYSITKISLCVKRKGPCGPFCLSSHKIHSDLKTITHILCGRCSPFHSSLLWLNILLYVWWLYYENLPNHILIIRIFSSSNSLSVYATNWYSSLPQPHSGQIWYLSKSSNTPCSASSWIWPHTAHMYCCMVNSLLCLFVCSQGLDKAVGMWAFCFG